MLGVGAPYSAALFKEFQFFRYSSRRWDMWAIRVVIFEVIVGTEMVQAVSDYASMERLLGDCCEYLDKGTE